MNPDVNLASTRARKARLARRFGFSMRATLVAGFVLLCAAAAYCLIVGGLARVGYAALSAASLVVVVLLWAQYDLQRIQPVANPTSVEDALEPHFLASLHAPLTPQTVWDAAFKNIEAQFLLNHILLDKNAIREGLTNNEQDMAPVWQLAMSLVDRNLVPEAHAGTLAAAMLIMSPAAQTYLTGHKLQHEDVLKVLSWLDRQLHYQRQPKP